MCSKGVRTGVMFSFVALAVKGVDVKKVKEVMMAVCDGGDITEEDIDDVIKDYNLVQEKMQLR